MRAMASALSWRNIGGLSIISNFFAIQKCTSFARWNMKHGLRNRLKTLQGCRHSSGYRQIMTMWISNFWRRELWIERYGMMTYSLANRTTR